MVRRSFIALGACVLAAGCTFDPQTLPVPDARVVDFGPPDAEPIDADPVDASSMDALAPDAEPPDADEPDAGHPADAEVLDAEPDAGVVSNTCGDGILDLNEACDDGNTVAADGCTACVEDRGFACVLEPSRCFPQSAVDVVDRSDPKCGDGDGADRVYCSISAAVSAGAGPLIIVNAGDYFENVVINDPSRERIFVARGVVTLSAESQPTLNIRDGANVTLVGFTITGTVGSAVGGALIELESANTRVSIFDCRIGASGAYGVELKSGAYVRMEHNLVVENARGGLRFDSNSGYFVVNNIIALNGSVATDVGGVYFKKTAVGAVFTNNTVAENIASGQPGGVRCDVAQTPVVNSVIWANVGNAPSGVSANCAPTYSCLSAAHAAISNVFADPQFADAIYRLGPGSPCLNVGHPNGVEPAGPAPKLDYEHRRRPLGNAVDMGAHESG